MISEYDSMIASLDKFSKEFKEPPKGFLVDIVKGGQIDPNLPKNVLLQPDYPKESSLKDELPALKLPKFAPNWTSWAQDMVVRYDFTEDEILYAMGIAFDELKETVEKPFSSFKLKIEAKKEIKPRDLCVLTEGKPYSPTSQKSEVQDDNTKKKLLRAMLIKMLIPCRFMFLNQKTEIAVLDRYQNVANSLLMNLGYSSVIFNSGFHDFVQKGTEFAMIADIKKACSILDMWVRITNKTENTGIKFCTLSTYGHSCTAITSLIEFTDKAGITNQDFGQYLFPSKLYEDFARVFQPGNEISNANSYTYYSVCLGVVTNIPYSASMNPYLFTFIHLIGLTTGSKRSFNAICRDFSIPETFLQLVMILSMKWRKSQTDTMPFAKTKEEIEKTKQVFEKLKQRAEEEGLVLDADETEEDFSEGRNIIAQRAAKKAREKIVESDIIDITAVDLFDKYKLEWLKKAPRICKIAYHSSVAQWLEHEPRENTIGQWLHQYMKSRQERKNLKNDRLSKNIKKKQFEKIQPDNTQGRQVPKPGTSKSKALSPKGPK